MDIMNAFRTVTTALKEWADKNKVQKVDGKGLSTNDYTTEEKNKLFGIEAGANKTVVDTTVNSNSTNPIQNKAVYDYVYELIGDKSVTDQIDELTEECITELFVSGTTIAYTKKDGTTGTIETQDTKYTHPSYTDKNSGLYKITVDKTGHISDATAVAKADITALGIPAQDTTYDNATTSTAGLMSENDKIKLDDIEEGANRTVVDDDLSPSSKNPVQNKIIYAEISQLTDAIQELEASGTSSPFICLDASGTLPRSSSWVSIAFGNNTFVAIAKQSSNIAYSYDGIIWEETQLPVSTEWASITYGGGYFVAVARNSTSCVYSTDGVSWTKRTMPSSKKWNSIAYGNGVFVAIAPDNVCAYGSITGTLQQGTLPSTANWRTVIFNGTRFIATSDNYATIAISTDGASWSTTSYYSIYEGIEDVASSDTGTCVALGVQASDQFYYSADGLNWTETTVPHGIWTAVTYGNGKFVAIECGSSRVMYSTNGTTWTNATLPVAEQWTDIAYGDGMFIAIANKSNVIAYSSNGTSWKSETLKVTNKDGNVITTELGRSLAGWTQIYDSNFITSKVNAIAGINVSGYKRLIVAIRSVNTTESAGGTGGAIVFEGDNGQEYAFTNIMPNLIQNTQGTSGGIAVFNITNGFIICENAMRAISAETMLCNVNGFGADNLTPVGSGIIKCTSPVVNMMVTNTTVSTKYYYGADSRVVVWGCKV